MPTWMMDATSLALAIRDKTLSPVEVVSAHFERIAVVNPKINAIVTLLERDAIAGAKAAEASVMRATRSVHFTAYRFTVKDSFDRAGVTTQHGSKLFAGYVPTRDATVVQRLRDAGAIAIAKTNLPEFSAWTETDNRVTGRTNNPWNLDRKPGGSSGGESAAIAAGCSPLGLGSDVAISLRGPAACIGIVALAAATTAAVTAGSTGPNALSETQPTRTVRSDVDRSAASASFANTACGSLPSGPRKIEYASATSRTVRAIGPACQKRPVLPG